MTITTDECIHGLSPATCSICLGPSRRNDEPVESLSELVREALAAYPGDDMDLVLRIVYAEATALPNAVDLFLPYLRQVSMQIDRGERRNIQRAVDLLPRSTLATSTDDRTASAASSQDEPTPDTPSIVSTARPGPFVLEAKECTDPITTTPPAPLPGRDHGAHDDQKVNVPPGSTLAQYSRERRYEVERSADDWMISFARKYAKAPLNLRNGWHGTVGTASLMQVRDKMTELRSQASGLADTLQMLGRVEKILVVHRACNLDEFNAAQKLPALEPKTSTLPIGRPAPEREEL